MQEIKLKSVTTVTIDSEIEVVDGIGQMFNLLNIPNTEEYHEARVFIIQNLIAFGEIDLSPAYPGHTVIVRNKFE